MNKETFISQPKYDNLSHKEKLRRWKQYQASVRSGRMPGRTRGTTMQMRQTRRGTLLESVLSPCAQEYFAAMTVPFALKQPACVPDLHALPSKKVRVKTRGLFSTGATGHGYCIVNTWANSNNSGAVAYSEAAWNPTLPPALPTSGAAGTFGVSQTKLPYTELQFQANGASPGVQARTVATALRIRYIGSEYTRSGQIVGIRHPDNETLRSLTFDDVKSFSTAKTFSNTKTWHYVMWRPGSPADYHFSPNPSDNDDGNATSSKLPLGFTVAGTMNSAGNPGPAPFEWELIRYVEYVGNIDNVTKSHVDINGMSHVRNSLPTKSTTNNPRGHFAKAIKTVEDSIGESLPAIGGGALAYKAATSAASEGGGILSTIEGALSSAAETAMSFLPEAGMVFEEAAPLALALI